MEDASKKHPDWGKGVLKKLFSLFLGGVFLFALLTSVYSALRVSTDLQDHWVNTKALISGSNIYDDMVYNQVSSMATSQYGLPPYDVYPIYPPSCYAMLAPFAMMNWTMAKTSWLILSLILTFLLVKELSSSFLEGSISLSCWPRWFAPFPGASIFFTDKTPSGAFIFSFWPPG